MHARNRNEKYMVFPVKNVYSFFFSYEMGAPLSNVAHLSSFWLLLLQFPEKLHDGVSSILFIAHPFRAS